jgi:hypothetical protein
MKLAKGTNEMVERNEPKVGAVQHSMQMEMI